MHKMWVWRDWYAMIDVSRERLYHAKLAFGWDYYYGFPWLAVNLAGVSVEFGKSIEF